MSEQVKGISERAPEPPYMDFPEAWAFVRTTKLEDHHMRCSWRSGVLCDCNVLWAEYYKRKAARSEQALAALEARNRELESLLGRAAGSMEYALKVGYRADDCGDHCGNDEARPDGEFVLYSDVAQLERTNAALLEALKRLATEMDYVHEAADMVRQGADVNLVRSSEGIEALKQARGAMIAKIPFPLAQHIARTYYPRPSLVESA